MKVRTGRPSGTRWVALVVVGSVVAVAAAFAVSGLVRSPWQAAVANSQRDPLVTVPVEDRTLKADVAEVRGTYSAGEDLDVAPPESEVPGVVTAKKVRTGDTVRSGDVLAEVSGRPVLALATPFRLYRDLTPDDEGPDVKAVQKALGTLGYYRGAVDGTYGPGTASAVVAWYRAAGYTVPVDDDLAQAVVDARKSLDEARKGLDDAPKDDDGATDDADGGPKADTGAVSDAATALAEAERAALPPLRVAEVVRIPASGAKVLGAAGVGADLADGGGEGSKGGSGAVVRLRVGEPSLTVRIGVASKKAYALGSEVTVHAVTDQKKHVTGAVTGVSEFRQPDADTVGGLPGYDVTVAFDGNPPFRDGDTLVVASLADAAPRASGPAVPLVALRKDTTGTYVTVVGKGRTAVDVVDTGDGYAILGGDAVASGDRVVVSGDPGVPGGSSAGAGR